MSEISAFLGITIYMNFESHDQPHFQAFYDGLHGMFSISKLSYSEGNLPPKVVGLVIDWAELHREELLANWESMKNTGSCRRIPSFVAS